MKLPQKLFLKMTNLLKVLCRVKFSKKMAIELLFKSLDIAVSKSHLYGLSESIDSLSFKYDNVILQGDFISCMEDYPIKKFCETYKLRNFIKDPTCFKNPENTECVDLALSFKNIYAIETGISLFHKMVVGV